MNPQKIAVFLFKNFPGFIRNTIYSICGFSINNADIRSNVLITNPKLLHIGKNVMINHNSSFIFGRGNAEIIIGDNVQIGPSCVFTTVSHDYSNPENRAGTRFYKSITVGKGTWICASCTILPGVTIGNGCVIAAGSVVNKDVPDNHLYGGVPVHPIKAIE